MLGDLCEIVFLYNIIYFKYIQMISYVVSESGLTKDHVDRKCFLNLQS